MSFPFSNGVNVFLLFNWANNFNSSDRFLCGDARILLGANPAGLPTADRVPVKQETGPFQEWLKPLFRKAQFPVRRFRNPRQLLLAPSLRLQC